VSLQIVKKPGDTLYLIKNSPILVFINEIPGRRISLFQDI